MAREAYTRPRINSGIQLEATARLDGNAAPEESEQTLNGVLVSHLYIHLHVVKVLPVLASNGSGFSLPDYAMVEFFLCHSQTRQS